jgi:hypothetical protein
MKRGAANPQYATCPYRDLPNSSLWADAVSDVPLDQIDPHLSGEEFQITRETRIGTAGSCFAQNITRALIANGLQYHITEPPPEWFSPQDRADYGYEVFSARFGNIYTPLQLLQLFERAFGSFQPQDQIWKSPDDRWFDLLRPRIQPHGFASRQELLIDLDHHLAAVRRLFETVDVLIFTLGLTEAWRSRRDGTVYPICPGCGVGNYDPQEYFFQNFTAAETVAHLDAFLSALQALNPTARVMLTVSPVPLAATYEPRHVLQSTVYSKSVLRVAAEEIVRRWKNVVYFASYEIITATNRNHEYFAPDRRNVSKAGVQRAITVFLERFVHGSQAEARQPPTDGTPPAKVGGSPLLATNAKGDVICDEAAIFEALADRRAA